MQSARKTSYEKMMLKKEKLDNNEALFRKGYLSNTILSDFHEQFLESLESYDLLKNDIAEIEIKISLLESELNLLPEKHQLKVAEIKRQLSQLNVEKVKLNNQFEFIYKAPEQGVVTAIHPNVGTRVSTDTPLFSIIPSNSPLEIELLLPTRSAGFVRDGDQVNIRFDAFPYQKFGILTGEVSNIDKALILPSESVLPVQINEPVYRVRAILKQQYISAYGEQFPLKVGMIADADIVLEKRSLLEWLLDPIYAVTGKLSS